MHAALNTRICDLFGVKYPIVQTGMGWVAGARLVAATSEAGALGIVASSTMSHDELIATIRKVKERTDKPFGVNIRSDAADAGDRVDAIIREKVKVASFALAPREDLIKKLKDAGVVVMPSIGAKRHAEKVAAWGADAVIVQGGEAGGHTGPVATTLLLPQIVDTVDIPVLGAGGFFDGRGLVAALAYGAAGIAMGTRFLLTEESTVPDSVKDYYLSKAVTDTIVTTKVDGVPHRVLRTPLVEELDRGTVLTRYPRAIRNAIAFKRLTGTPWSTLARDGLAMKQGHELGWDQVLMAANTPMLLKAALVDGHVDSGVMSSGQVVGLIDSLPSAGDVVRGVIAEADAVLARLGGA